MKTRLITLTTLLTALALAATADPVETTELGLSKTSVFDTPTPVPFSYAAPQPSQSEPLPRAYGGFEGAPPRIPHAIDAFMPITAKSNSCASCHDRPHLIGKTQKGAPTPMPQSHYGGFKGEGGKKDLSGARYVCTQCHVPQSGAAPLVANTLE